MSGEPRVHGWRWLRHVAWVSALSIFIAVAAIIFFFGSGLGNPLIRHTLVRRLEAATGARVEVRTVSIHWLSLRATLKGLEIHGHEPAGTEPLFSAEEIQAGLRIDSLWHREFSLNDLVVRQPRVHIRVAKDGSSNVPTPPRPLSSKKPLRETLFDLHVKEVKIENGWIFYNDVRTPMTLEGGDLRVALDASGPLEQTLYSGNIDWKKVVFTAQRYLPIPIGIAAKFTLGRDGLHLDQGIFSAARSRKRQASINGNASASSDSRTGRCRAEDEDSASWIAFSAMRRRSSRINFRR